MASRRLQAMGCLCILISSRRNEGAAPTKKAPIFAEAAQIHTVDTLEGLACTHEVGVAVVY